MLKKKPKTNQEKQDTENPHTEKNTAEKLNKKVKEAYNRIDTIHKYHQKNKKEMHPEYEGPLYPIRLPNNPKSL
jgi:hypothetical protein